MTNPIQTREIHYTALDGTSCIGYFAAPEGKTALAGVIVAPEWWGRTKLAEQRARELAEHGYAAFTIDMYGDKKITDDAKQAYEWMMQTFQQPETIVTRASSGLNTLIEQPEVNQNQLAAVGFCYGGKVVLDLARSGASLKSVTTFHANLSTQTPAEKDKFKAEVLVLHGEADTMVTLADVENFKQEMLNADIQHDVKVFSGAKHGFTNPLADEHAKAGHVDLGYDAKAEKAGFEAMYQLLARTLNK